MALEWTRPLGALALLLPVVVWLLARRRARPVALPIGTFRLWGSAPVASAKSRPRGRTPLELWLLLLALVLGAIALAGPRRTRGPERVVWRAVVDRSPSMYTPCQGMARHATRLDVALEHLARAASERGASVVSWRAVDGAGEHTERPAAWADAPAIAQREPRWERFDEPDAVWVTDRVPELEPEFAGVIASGGAAVPLTVAMQGTTALVWDGVQLFERPGATRAPRFHVEPGVPEPIADLVRAWALERGVEEADPTDGLALHVVAAPSGGGDSVEVLLEHEGWRARARIVELGPPALGSWTWLSHADRSVVRARPGVLELALTELEDPLGDPAFFGVSWSALLDRVVVPAPGVAPMAEFGAAGDALVRVPRAGVAEGDGDDRKPLVFWLSAVATACAAAAFVVRGCRESGPDV